MKNKLAFILTLVTVIIALSVTIWFVFLSKFSDRHKNQAEVVKTKKIPRPLPSPSFTPSNEINEPKLASPPDVAQPQVQPQQTGKHGDQENKVQIPSPAQGAPGVVESPEKIKVMMKGREVVGPERLNYVKSSQQLQLRFINKYNPQWKNILSENLSRFKAEGTKVEIIPKKSYIQIFHTNARFIEEVLVNTTLPSGQQLSYQASVDSQSGQILETWNKTRREFPTKVKETFTPSERF